MRFARLAAAASLAAALAAATSSATAQQPKAEPPPAPAQPAAQPAAAAGAKKPNAVRKDPNNKTGISPYMETVAKGEKAFVSGDSSGAAAAFQEAINIDGSQMLAYYRLGEVHLAGGKRDEAEAAWQTALGKKGPDEVHAKVLFVLADLRERQAKHDAAREAWGAYASFIQDKPTAKGHSATPPERQRVIEKRAKDEKDYAAVKDRIAKRQAEREKEAEENAKKDKLNR